MSENSVQGMTDPLLSPCRNVKGFRFVLLSSLFHMPRVHQEVVPALADWHDHLKGFLRRAGEN